MFNQTQTCPHEKTFKTSGGASLQDRSVDAY